MLGYRVLKSERTETSGLSNLILRNLNEFALGSVLSVRLWLCTGREVKKGKSEGAVPNKLETDLSGTLRLSMLFN